MVPIDQFRINMIEVFKILVFFTILQDHSINLLILQLLCHRLEIKRRNTSISNNESFPTLNILAYIRLRNLSSTYVNRIASVSQINGN